MLQCKSVSTNVPYRKNLWNLNLNTNFPAILVLQARISNHDPTIKLENEEYRVPQKKSTNRTKL